MTLWELIKDISQVLTPVVIGLLAVYIAYQQHRITKIRFKFELYEKRFNVYQKVNYYLAATLIKDTLGQEDFDELRSVISESYFLFGAEIPEYLEEMWKKGRRHKNNLKAIVSPSISESKRQEKVKEIEEIEDWFDNQFNQARVKFNPYLNISELK